MSLSDDEQRILNEMEAQLAESDPRLVDDVTSTTVYTAAFKNIKWSLLLLVVGVVVMIFTLSTSFLLAAVGFLIMLAAALILEKSLTKLGKVGLNQMMQSSQSGSLGKILNSIKKNVENQSKKRKGA